MNLPVNCCDCPVWKKSLFNAAHPDLIQRLAEKKKTIRFTKKDQLFKQGQEVTGIYCHMIGLAKVVQKDTNDKIRFSRLVLPGDTSGHRSLFIESNYQGTAGIMSDELIACFIPKSEILYLLSNQASFAKNLVHKISTELVRSEENQISVKEKTVRDRLAKLLYDLCNDYSEQVNDKQYLIKSEITKREIASLLSVANETIIRLMSEMKSENLISYEEKKLIINDLDKLKKMARLRN